MVPLAPQQIGIPTGISPLDVPHGLVYIRAVFTQTTGLCGVCCHIVLGRIGIRHRCVPLAIERTAVICWGEIGGNVCNGIDGKCSADGLADKSLDIGGGVFKIAIYFQGMCTGSNHQVRTIESNIGRGVGQLKSRVGACSLRGEGDGFCSATLGCKSCAGKIVRACNIVVGRNDKCWLQARRSRNGVGYRCKQPDV